MNPIGLADLRALSASFLLYYLTGLPLARCLARGAGGPAFAWALPCSLAILMGALFLTRLLGLGLSAATWVVALTVLAAMLGPALLERRQRSSSRPDAGGEVPGVSRGPIGTPGRTEDQVRPFEWGLIGVVVAVLLSVGGPLGIIYDAFDHLAAIRRTLLSNAIMPLDIFYRGGDGIGWDPRKGFLHPLHAFTCRLVQVDPLNLWRVLPAVLGPGVLLAVSRFVRAWTGAGRRGDFALLAWVLFGWGSGFLWLVRTGYPNHVAYPFSLFALALAIEHVFDRGAATRVSPSGSSSPYDRGSRTRLVGIGVLAFCGALIHLVAPVLLMAGLGLLGVAIFVTSATGAGRFAPRAGIRHLGPVARTFLAAGIGMLGPVAFRLLTQGRADSTLHTHLQGLFFLGRGWFVASPLFALAEIGPAGILALIVLPFAVRAVPSNRRLALVLFTAAPWIAVGTPLFTPLYRVLGYLVTRFLALVPAGAVLVLALEAIGQRIGRRPRASLSTILAGVLGIAVLATAAWTVSRLPAQYRHEAGQARGVEGPLASAGGFQLIHAAVQAAPVRPPVVLSDPFTSYAVGGITGAYAVSTLNQHGPPNDRRWRERLDDENEMLLGLADPARIDSLFRAYEVGLVYVNQALWMPVSDFASLREGPSLERARRHIEEDAERFTVIYRGPDGIVAAVRPDQRTTTSRSGSISPPPPPPPGDSLRVSPGPFRLGAVSAVDVILPARTLHWRETIGIPLSWVRTDPIAGDLPLVVQLRMRTPVPPRWYARPAWDKLARFATQRRDQLVYRFRRECPPFDGERSLARLPLNQPVPDTLRIRIPPCAAPGDYEVTVALTEKTFLPNFQVRDLLRDEDSFEGPVVGRVTIRK